MGERSFIDDDMSNNGDNIGGETKRLGDGETFAPTRSVLSPRLPVVSSVCRRLFVRLVSVLLVLCMLADPSLAAGISDLVRVSFSSNLADLNVPARFGAITDRWTATPDGGMGRWGDEAPRHFAQSPRRPIASSAFVVLIQDLHANIGVQKNIAGIVEHLYNRFHFGRAYTEAAFGPCDVSLLRSIPNRRLQRALIDQLLSKALLSGADLGVARVGRGRLSPMKLTGIDDPMLYLANVQAFRDLARVGPQAALEWRSLKELLLPGAEPRLRRHLELTEKLLGLQLTDDEWLEYQEHRNLTPHGSPGFMAAIAAGERFYTAAQARNDAMADNLLQEMGLGDKETWRQGETNSPRLPVSPSAGPVILVTGGFHTASIAHRLKTRGVSFAVVTPVVDRLDQQELYVRSLTEPPHETVEAFDTMNERGSRVIGSLAARIRDHFSAAWSFGRLKFRINASAAMLPDRSLSEVRPSPMARFLHWLKAYGYEVGEWAWSWAKSATVKAWSLFRRLPGWARVAAALFVGRTVVSGQQISVSVNDVGQRVAHVHFDTWVKGSQDTWTGASRALSQQGIHWSPERLQHIFGAPQAKQTYDIVSAAPQSAGHAATAAGHAITAAPSAINNMPGQVGQATLNWLTQPFVNGWHGVQGAVAQMNAAAVHHPLLAALVIAGPVLIYLGYRYRTPIRNAIMRVGLKISSSRQVASRPFVHRSEAILHERIGGMAGRDLSKGRADQNGSLIADGRRPGQPPLAAPALPGSDAVTRQGLTPGVAPTVGQPLTPGVPAAVAAVKQPSIWQRRIVPAIDRLFSKPFFHDIRVQALAVVSFGLMGVVVVAGLNAFAIAGSLTFLVGSAIVIPWDVPLGQLDRVTPDDATAEAPSADYKLAVRDRFFIAFQFVLGKIEEWTEWSPPWLDQAWTIAIKGSITTRRMAPTVMKILDETRNLQKELSAIPTEAERQALLMHKRDDFTKRLKDVPGTTLDSLLPEAFAVVNVVNMNVLGNRLYRTQLMAGIALFEGTIAHMRTGEGKTRVAALPAYLLSLNGRKGMMVLTWSDYLAHRDVEGEAVKDQPWKPGQRGVYEALGMSV
ncbi:MAG TPA: hypothetical protein VMU17_05955, partial [Elusimicrobiota bacterium]|nr:hypothetical protein [Elusimicrobiota bacterium]